MEWKRDETNQNKKPNKWRKKNSKEEEVERKSDSERANSSIFFCEIKEIKKSRIDKRKSYYLFDRQWSQKTIKHADRY